MYEILNDVFFTEFDKPEKIKIFYGGSGSGKSISIAQYFILGLISGDGYNRAVFRKTFPSMKLSTYLVLKSILDHWNIPYKDHQTDHYFEVGPNRLYYLNLEDPERIKGVEYKDVWLEEATEFTEDDFKQLRIRLARDKRSEEVNILLSFNPIDQGHWAVKYIASGESNILVHHSDYHDNAINLSQTFIKELESWIDKDENFYRVYCLGEPGVLKNKIYSHFKIENPVYWPWASMKDSLHAYGVDWGWNHPTAMIEAWYYNGEFYIREVFYQKEKTTDDLMYWMAENGISHSDYIFADAAEPDRIEMLNTSRTVTVGEIPTFISRYNVIPAKKDVLAGIDFVKSHKIHISNDSLNLIREYNNYKYKEDKNGNVLEEPVKLFDDLLDAIRYCLYTLNTQYGLSDYECEIKKIKEEEEVGFSIASSSRYSEDIWNEEGYGEY